MFREQALFSLSEKLDLLSCLLPSLTTLGNLRSQVIKPFFSDFTACSVCVEQDSVHITVLLVLLKTVVFLSEPSHQNFQIGLLLLRVLLRLWVGFQYS